MVRSQAQPPPTSGTGRVASPRTIIVTGADRPAGAIVVALLTHHGHRVVGLDAPRRRETAPGEAAGPGEAETEVPANIPALARLVTETGADLVVPTLPAELAELSAARTLLEGLGASVLVAGAGPVALASDRLFVLSYLHSRDVPVPRFALPGDVRGVDEAVELFGGPFVASPRSKRSLRVPMLVTGAEDVDWELVDDGWILRESLPGEHYRVLAHRPLQGRSGRLAVVVRDPSGEDRSEATGGAWPAVTAAAVRVESPEIERRALAAIRAVGLTGPSTVEVMLGADGSPVVTDIDATFGQHLRLAPELLEVAVAPGDEAPAGGSPSAGSPA